MEFNNRTRINLSGLAKKILEQDIFIFNADEQKQIGTYINKVLHAFTKIEIPVDNNLAKEKGTSEVYYINDKNIDWFVSCASQTRAYKEREDDSSSTFFKVIIESYCRLPYPERANFILHECIQNIETAIARQTKITLETYNKLMKVSPYKIVPSKDTVFTYLVFKNDKKFDAIRLSLIKSVRVLRELYHFNKEEMKLVDNALINFGPSFAFENMTTIHIKFLNEDGEKRCLYSTLQRPMHERIIDKNERIYEFKCSEKQILYFFFSFAGDIEIIEPIELKNRFKQMYKDGYETI